MYYWEVEPLLGTYEVIIGWTDEIEHTGVQKYNPAAKSSNLLLAVKSPPVNSPSMLLIKK